MEPCRHHRQSRRPLTFTPSLFRSFDHKKRKGDRTLTRALPFPLEEGRTADGPRVSRDSFGNSSSDSDSNHGRPDHEHDGWECRCRCRFGEWLGFTSVVAASIHLCRIINVKSDRDQLELSRVDNTCRYGGHLTVFADFRDAVHNSWQQLLFRAAPVLFPDLFKRWYVLPATRHLSVTASNAQPLEERGPGDESSQHDTLLPPDQSSPSTSPVVVSRTTSTSGDCAVQTDGSLIGTPFDDFMLESGRRLAAISRMTDVGLEHAIGVDLLKRRLYDEAIDYLLGAARSGHAGALYNVGICHSRGFGVRRDMTKAVEMWRAAADQGHGLSKYQMGVCHARGLGGLAMDHDRALRYMEAAASVGVPEAKTYLAANEYKHGRLEGALELLRQAMAGGDEQAKDLLQECSSNGQSKQRDSSDGYVFEKLAKVKVDLPVPSAAIKRVNSGRRRFWASSSSEKEDSLSSSSSPLKSESSRRSSSSVMFCDDDDSLECGNKKAPVEVSGSQAIETVASLLTLGSLRRSSTAHDFRSVHKHDVASVSTGDVSFF